MKTIYFLVILFSGQVDGVVGMQRIDVFYDTGNDCDTTAQLLSQVPGVYSTECIPFKVPVVVNPSPILERGI